MPWAVAVAAAGGGGDDDCDGCACCAVGDDDAGCGDMSAVISIFHARVLLVVLLFSSVYRTVCSIHLSTVCVTIAQHCCGKWSGGFVMKTRSFDEESHTSSQRCLHRAWHWRRFSSVCRHRDLRV